MDAVTQLAKEVFTTMPFAEVDTNYYMKYGNQKSVWFVKKRCFMAIEVILCRGMVPNCMLLTQEK